MHFVLGPIEAVQYINGQNTPGSDFIFKWLTQLGEIWGFYQGEGQGHITSQFRSMDLAMQNRNSRLDNRINAIGNKDPAENPVANSVRRLAPTATCSHMSGITSLGRPSERLQPLSSTAQTVSGREPGDRRLEMSACR